MRGSIVGNAGSDGYKPKPKRVGKDSFGLFLCFCGFVVVAVLWWFCGGFVVVLWRFWLLVDEVHLQQA
jgi:hypothetical protein